MQTTRTKHLLHKYRRLFHRLERQIKNGTFSSFDTKKQHQSLLRLQRYARRLAIPAAGALLSGMPITDLAAQRPAGTEFKVNAFSGGAQNNSDAAASANRRSLIVYESASLDGDAKGIYFKLYDENSAQVGVETRVNTYTTGNQLNPSVAMDANGDFVVVWQSFGQDGSSDGVLTTFCGRWDLSW